MIQRQQSLWLLSAAVCSFLSFIYPFFGGTNQNATATSGTMFTLNGGSNFFLMILTGGSILLSLITIFLFKDRRLQLKLTLAGLVIAVIAIVLYFSEMKKMAGVIALSSVFVFIIPICYIMAARGIWKDEKLVKSLDKLR
jgi:hypothetical protein